VRELCAVEPLLLEGTEGATGLVVGQLVGSERPEVVVRIQGMVWIFDEDSGDVIVHNPPAPALSHLLADLTGDGLLDLAVGTADPDAQLVVYEFDQDGGTDTLYSVGGAPIAMAAADVDNDNLLDLVFVDDTARDVRLSRNGGANGFTLASGALVQADDACGVFVVDRDANPTADLVVLREGGGNVYLGDGLGGLTSGTSLPASVSCAGDGFALPGGRAALIVGQQTGALGALIGSYPYLGLTIEGVGVLADAAWAPLIPGTLQAFIAVDDGIRLASIPFVGGSASVGAPVFLAGVSELATADMNEDGIRDVVAIGSGGVSILLRAP
jgi:FG-GAP-like repeat